MKNSGNTGILLVICILLAALVGYFGYKEYRAYEARVELREAETRKAVTSYNSMEAVVATYYARNRKHPNINADGLVDAEPYHYIDPTLRRYPHKFYACDKTGVDFDNASNSICAVTYISLYLACNIETMKDDENYDTGEGRIIDGTHTFQRYVCKWDETPVKYVYKLF